MMARSSAARSRRPARLAAALLSCSLAAACGAYGPGFAELPASAGWERLPIGDWLVNDGLTPLQAVFCPKAACPHEALVATFEARGDLTSRAERLLDDPATILAALRRPSAAARSGKVQPGTVDVAPLHGEGLRGLRVAMASRDGRRRAAVVVLGRQRGDHLRLVLSVSEDADAALANARKTARPW